MGAGWVGTEFFGSVTATLPIQFAIMNQAQYNTFSSHTYKANACRLAAEAVVYQGSVTNYSLDWVVPDGDTYYFIFFNPNSATTSVTFTMLTTLRATSQSSTPTTYKPTNTVPTTSVTPIPTQTSASSTPALPIPPVTINPQSNYGWLLPVLVVAIAGIVTFMVVAYAWPRIHSGTTEPKVTAPKPTKSVVQTAEKAAGKQFCLNCGAELPPKSKFCNKCGSIQS